MAGDQIVWSAINAFSAAAMVFVSLFICRYSLRQNILAKEIMEWYHDCLKALVEFRTHPEKKDTYYGEFYQLLERGRLFFRNKERWKKGWNEEGKYKPKEYRGYRDISLTFLVLFQNIVLQETEVRRECEKELIELQRLFSSQVFKYVRHPVVRFCTSHFDKWYSRQPKERQQMFFDIVPYIIEDRVRHLIQDRFRGI